MISFFFFFKKTMISHAILVAILSLLPIEISSAPPPTETCPSSCGDVAIPFPFGTSSDCNLDDSFLITCNHSYNPPKPFLNLGTIEVLEISLDGLLRVASSVASDCYNTSGSRISSTISELTSSKFPISSTRNKFTAVGCDTQALVRGSEEWKQMSGGCVSWCDSLDNVLNGTCSGIGCCETSIPKGIKDFHVDILSFKNHTLVNSFNPCGYAFVVETEAYEFSLSHLKYSFRNIMTVPVVLDWSVGNLTCQDARKNLSRFSCLAMHSECSDSDYGLGYHCKCLTGFQGNPYLIDGCRDIDECTDLHPCEGACMNTPGSYSCSCPKGLDGDGKKNGSGCHPKTATSGSTAVYVASGLIVPAIGISWIFWRRKENKVNRLRHKLFHRNGGHLLEGRITIFKAEDLKKATNNYNESNVLSIEQHFGINYKGMLPNGQIVTIMKCDTLNDESDIDVFVNKVISLSRVNHRNVVQLLGCCLETQAPLLVYEFCEIETLYDYIHDDNRACHLSWDVRLRIAAETARLLGHMHSCSDGPIIHGSLSSSSILLHHGYNVKVQDYAKIIFDDYIGRVGYLDPELFLMGRFTEKSDVYSFGVILAEMLTGKKVFSLDRPKGEENLAQYFVNRGDNLVKILDPILRTDGKIEMLTQVCKLAERCLSESSDNRPTMRQVIIALGKAGSMDSGSSTISLESRQGRGARRRNRSF